MPGPPMPQSANSSPNPAPWASVRAKRAPEGQGAAAGRRACPALAVAARLPPRQTPHRYSPRMTGRFKRRRLRRKEMMARLRPRARKPMRERRPYPRHRTWIQRQDGTKFRRDWRSPRGRTPSIRPAQNAPAGGNARAQASAGCRSVPVLWFPLLDRERNHGIVAPSVRNRMRDKNKGSRLAGHARVAPKHQARMPFCTCSRFSASSKTTDCGPSITSSVTSSPRWAGKQCMKIASLPAQAISFALTW